MTRREGSREAETRRGGEAGSRAAAPSASQIEGTVREQLEYGLYRVEVDGHHEMIAHAPGGPAKNFVRLLIGDRVLVEISVRDAKRGRIVKKL